MSISALKDVSTEVRRLSIAGASLAPADFRLQNLIAPLEKSGEKSPIFAKVAGAVADVVEADDKSAAGKLLDLSTLVNAILYTQGETGIEGDLQTVAACPVQGTTTKTSYRVLAPLIDALTTSGQGRYEIIEDAWKRGAFRDVRLIRPAILALGDRYGELATLVEDKVIPSFGAGIAPLLREGLDPKGGVIHARRLRALSGVDPDAAKAVARELADESTKEMKIAVIGVLRGSSGDVDILMEATKSKVKDIRRAAYSALAGIPVTAVKELFRELIQSKDLELVSDTIGDALSDDLVGPLVSEGQGIMTELTKSKSPAEKSMNRLMHVLQAVSGNMNTEAETFVLSVFEKRDHFSNLRKVAIRSLGAELNGEVAYVIAIYGSEPAKRELIKARNRLGSSQIGCALLAAARLDSPARVHKEFSALLAGDSEVGEAIEGVIRGWNSYSYRRYDFEELTEEVEWDEAWCKAAMKSGRTGLVRYLAKPGYRKVEAYLKKCLQYGDKKKLIVKKDDDLTLGVLETLIELGCKDAPKLVCQAIESVLGGSKYHWHRYPYFSLIPELPSASVRLVEKFVKTLPEKDIDDVLPYLAELKTKAAQTQL